MLCQGVGFGVNDGGGGDCGGGAMTGCGGVRRRGKGERGVCGGLISIVLGV